MVLVGFDDNEQMGANETQSKQSYANKIHTAGVMSIYLPERNQNKDILERLIFDTPYIPECNHPVNLGFLLFLAGHRVRQSSIEVDLQVFISIPPFNSFLNSIEFHRGKPASFYFKSSF